MTQGGHSAHIGWALCSVATRHGLAIGVGRQHLLARLHTVPADGRAGHLLQQPGHHAQVQARQPALLHHRAPRGEKVCHLAHRAARKPPRRVRLQVRLDRVARHRQHHGGAAGARADRCVPRRRRQPLHCAVQPAAGAARVAVHVAQLAVREQLAHVIRERLHEERKEAKPQCARPIARHTVGHLAH
eukprot:202061-Chlamydomonas_euryale.AAC.8